MAKRFREQRLTKDNKILLRGNADSHLNTAFVLSAAREGARSKTKKWAGLIKPSQLRFDMCLETWQKECDQPKSYPIELRLKFFFGNAVHKYLGQFIKEHCPEFYVEPTLTSPHAQKWYQYSKPEVPIVSEKWMTKGLIDWPARLKNSLWIVDWKTTWEAKESWLEFCDNPRVKPEYIAQGASYCFLAEQESLFGGEAPTHFSNVFINLSFDPASKEAWKEVYFDYEPYREDTELLWSLLVEALQAKLAGSFVPCRNQYCKDHGRADIRTLGKFADPWKPRNPIKEESYASVGEHPFLARARDYFQVLGASAEEDSITWEKVFGEIDGSEDTSL